MDRDFVISELISRLDIISSITTSTDLDLLSECMSDKDKKKRLIESLDRIENLTKEIRNLI